MTIYNIFNFISPILPELSLILGAVFILMQDVYLARKFNNFFKVNYVVALVAIFVSLFFAVTTSTYPKSLFYSFLFSNGFTVLVKICLSVLLIFVVIFAYEFIAKRKEMSAEFLSLVMLSTAGAMFLIGSNDFLTFYLSLELQSLPLYLLAAMNRKSKDSSEGGVKYFILGSTASGILLLGISIFYGFSGTTNFDVAFNLYSQTDIPPAVILGFVLIITAIFFKISAAPFHMWTPDVYQGSHAAITNFFATISKFASTLILVRIFLDLSTVSTSFVGINNVLILVAILSLAVGSLGAIMQKDLKRLLAYSSIGHIGFVLFGLSAISLEGIKSCVIYMIIYAALSLGNFGFLTLITNNETDDAKDKERYKISNLSGLAAKYPFLALCFATLMFSTAGIPPLAGFFSKFYVILATIKQGYYITSIAAILFSVISAYYYLKIVKIMYFDEAKESDEISFYDRKFAKTAIFIVAAANASFIFYLKDFASFTSRFLGF